MLCPRFPFYIPPGRTLRNRLRESGDVDHATASQLIGRLARALDYAHSLGVIHRDIKPDNILLDEAGVPHIADFGLARHDESAALRTQEGVRMGTPAYMRPEQHTGKSHEADGRSDQWSLGVMLYEMLAGERPFHGDAMQLAYAVRDTRPEPPRKKNAAIPRDLETICLKCLAKEADRRYASCAELADDLAHWQNNEPITARRVSVPERLWRWSKRNPSTSRLAGTVVLITAIALVAVSWQWRQAQGTLAQLAAAAGSLEQLEGLPAKVTQLEKKATEDAANFAVQLEKAGETQKQAVPKIEELERKVQALHEDSEKKDAELSLTKTDAVKDAAERDKALAACYRLNVRLAYREWFDGDVGNSLRLLNDCPSSTRDWEWYYLDGLHHCGVWEGVFGVRFDARPRRGAESAARAFERPKNVTSVLTRSEGGGAASASEHRAGVRCGVCRRSVLHRIWLYRRPIAGDGDQAGTAFHRPRRPHRPRTGQRLGRRPFAGSHPPRCETRERHARCSVAAAPNGLRLGEIPRLPGRPHDRRFPARHSLLHVARTSQPDEIKRGRSRLRSVQSRRFIQRVAGGAAPFRGTAGSGALQDPQGRAATPAHDQRFHPQSVVSFPASIQSISSHSFSQATLFDERLFLLPNLVIQQIVGLMSQTNRDVGYDVAGAALNIGPIGLLGLTFCPPKFANEQRLLTILVPQLPVIRAGDRSTVIDQPHLNTKWVSDDLSVLSILREQPHQESDQCRERGNRDDQLHDYRRSAAPNRTDDGAAMRADVRDRAR